MDENGFVLLEQSRHSNSQSPNNNTTNSQQRPEQRPEPIDTDLEAQNPQNPQSENRSTLSRLNAAPKLIKILLAVTTLVAITSSILAIIVLANYAQYDPSVSLYIILFMICHLLNAYYRFRLTVNPPPQRRIDEERPYTFPERMLRLLGNIRIIGVFVGIILMNDKYNLPWPMYYMAFYYIGYELVVVLLPLLTLAVVLLTCPTVLVRILLVSRRMLGADSNVMPGDPFGRVRGLKRELLGRIPESTYHSNNTSSEEGEQCVICLVEFVEGDMVKQIPGCKHQFHSKCIDEWLLINHHCPLCMQDVSSRLESE